MHKIFQNFFSCPPHLSGSKFPSDSRGSLRLAVVCREVGLLDRNVRHTIKMVHFFSGQISCHWRAKFGGTTGKGVAFVKYVYPC